MDPFIKFLKKASYLTILRRERSSSKKLLNSYYWLDNFTSGLSLFLYLSAYDPLIPTTYFGRSMKESARTIYRVGP